MERASELRGEACAPLSNTLFAAAADLVFYSCGGSFIIQPWKFRSLILGYHFRGGGGLPPLPIITGTIGLLMSFVWVQSALDFIESRNEGNN